jgi:hypothetical protein
MNNLLVGTWQLLSWTNTSLEGVVTHPFGEDVQGYISYTDSGHMSVHISHNHRPNFAGHDLLGGSDPEKISAAETYFTYCGTYTFDGVQVTHRIKSSLFPNWNNTDQVRLVTLTPDTLTLRSNPMLLRGKTQVAQLIWKRV